MVLTGMPVPKNALLPSIVDDETVAGQRFAAREKSMDSASRLFERMVCLRFTRHYSVHIDARRIQSAVDKGVNNGVSSECRGIDACIRAFIPLSVSRTVTSALMWSEPRAQRIDAVSCPQVSLIRSTVHMPSSAAEVNAPCCAAGSNQSSTSAPLST
jgi:hypothetical protein